MGTRLLNAELDLPPLAVIDKHGATVVVRMLTTADRRALEAMYDAFEPKRAAQGLPPRSPVEVRHWLDRALARGIHLCAELDGVIIAHVMLIPMEDGRVELANFLHQSMRNRGIGTALNRVALDVAAGAGWRNVWLSVEPSNRAALRSYEKAGFRRLPGSLWSPEIEMQADLDVVAPAL